MDSIYFQKRIFQYLKYPVALVILYLSFYFSDLLTGDYLPYFLVLGAILLSVFAIQSINQEYRISKGFQKLFWLKENHGKYRYFGILIFIIDAVFLLFFIKVFIALSDLEYRYLYFLPIILLAYLARKLTESLNYYSGDIQITKSEVKFSYRYRKLKRIKNIVISSIEKVIIGNQEATILFEGKELVINYDELRNEDKDALVERLREISQ